MDMEELAWLNDAVQCLKQYHKIVNPKVRLVGEDGHSIDIIIYECEQILKKEEEKL